MLLILTKVLVYEVSANSKADIFVVLVHLTVSKVYSLLGLVVPALSLMSRALRS